MVKNEEMMTRGPFFLPSEICAAHAGRVHAFFAASGMPKFRKFFNLIVREIKKLHIELLLDLDARRAPFRI